MPDSVYATVFGFALFLYIVLYAVFLLRLILGAPRETKLVRLYGNRKDRNGGRKARAAVLGGVLCALFVYAFLEFI